MGIAKRHLVDHLVNTMSRRNAEALTLRSVDGDRRAGAARAVVGLVGVLLLWVVAMVVGTLVAHVAFGSVGDELGSPSAVAAQHIVPPLFGLVVTVTVVSRRHWWTPTLSDSVPTRPWVWVVPGLVVAGALITTDWARVGSARGSLLLWFVLGILTVAVSEELLFRGLVLTALRERFSEAVAAGWTIVLFAVIHSVGALELSPLQLVSTASGGVVYYLTKRVSSSIWAAVVVHALVDFSLFSITLGVGETDDNRGPVVLLALVLACLVALVGIRWIKPRGPERSTGFDEPGEGVGRARVGA
jgi:membrane protease YdiL (CAAX protease family)